MRRIPTAMALVALCAASGFAPAHAALTQDQFPPKTTADLIALCNAQNDDPLVVAAKNYCQGFAEGVVDVALSYAAVTRKDRQPFCLPAPRPTHKEALAQFVSWANADPSRLQDPPALGVLSFLVQQYPCPRAPMASTKKQ